MIMETFYTVLGILLIVFWVSMAYGCWRVAYNRSWKKDLIIFSCAVLFIIGIITISLWRGWEIPTNSEQRECEMEAAWVSGVSPGSKSTTINSILRKIRCLIDKDTRNALLQKKHRREVKRIKNLIVSFNNNLAIMEPRGYDLEKFEHIPHINDLPEIVEKNLGRLFWVDAAIRFWGSDTYDGADEESITLVSPVRNDASDPNTGQMANAHLLNDYQKQFLEMHCSLGKAFSCEGKVFLTVAKHPQYPFFMNLEIIGALFRKADKTKVISSLKH